MVHAVDFIDLIRNVTDLVEGVRSENVSLVYLHHQGDHVRTTKDFSMVVVRLNVWMALRQQISKLAVHFYLARLPGPKGGSEQYHCQCQWTIAPNKIDICKNYTISEAELRLCLMCHADS